MVAVDDLAGIFDPLMTLRQDLHEKTVAAVGRFQADPQDPLDASRTDIESFFHSFCVQLESIGRGLLTSLDSRRDTLKDVNEQLTNISVGFSTREEATQKAAIAVLDTPFPEQPSVTQPLPERPLVYRSIYAGAGLNMSIRMTALEPVTAVVEPAALIVRSDSLIPLGIPVESFFDFNGPVVDPFENVDINFESLGETGEVVEVAQEEKPRTRKWTGRFKKTDDGIAHVGFKGMKRSTTAPASALVAPKEASPPTTVSPPTDGGVELILPVEAPPDSAGVDTDE
jgi:hypothetical protein